MRNGKEVFVIEKRDKDGRLDFSEPRPPMHLATEDELFAWWFRENPTEDKSISYLDLFNVWLPSKGFSVRLKTW